MPEPTTAELEDALINADAAGATEDARQLADELEIRSRRANTGPGVQDVEPPDPFPGAPTTLNGVEIDQRTRGLILEFRAVEDPKQALILRGRINARFLALGNIKPSGFIEKAGLAVAGGRFGTASRALLNVFLGAGDAITAGAGAARSQFTQNPLSLGDSLEVQREFRRALEEEFPGTAITAEVAGSLLAGFGLATAVKGVVKGGGPLASLVANAATLQGKQKFLNFLRVVIPGAVVGGTTQAVREGQPGFGALTGGLGSAAFLGVFRVGQAVVRRFADSPSARGLRAFAKKVGVKAEELAADFLNFRAVTGKAPSLNDLLNPQAIAETRDILSDRVAGINTANRIAEDIARRRGGELAEQVPDGLVTSSVAGEKTKRIALETKQFALAVADDIKFSPDQIDDILNDKEFSNAIGSSLKSELGDILDLAGEGLTAVLPGTLINNMRKNLNFAIEQAKSGLSGNVDKLVILKDDFLAVAGAQSRNFARAIRESSNRRTREEGIKFGERAAKSATEPKGFASEAAANLDPNFLAAARPGVRTALVARAGGQGGAATKLAKDLTQQGGNLEKNLRVVLPGREVDRLLELGLLQTRSIENLKAVVPPIRAADTGFFSRLFRNITEAGVIATGRGSGNFIVSAIQGAIRTLTPRMSPKVAKRLAEDLFSSDPKVTQAAITAIQRAGVSAGEILNFVAVPAAIAVGGETASVLGREKE